MSSNTLCEHCIFKECDSSGQQTGCKILGYHGKDRLQIFQEYNLAERQENGKFIIKSHCNTCRNVYWQPYVDDSFHISTLLSKVEEETKVTYSALIHVDGASKEDVKNMINTLKSYLVQPVDITLFGKMAEENSAIWQEFLSRYVTLSLSIHDNPLEQCQDAVRKAKGNYLLFLTPGILPEFNPDDLEYSANQLLTPILHRVETTYYLVLSYIYKVYMYDANPIASISKGLSKDDESESEHSDSKL